MDNKSGTVKTGSTKDYIQKYRKSVIELGERASLMSVSQIKDKL